jgi:hypothetical protein
MNGGFKNYIVSHDLYKIIEAYVEENPKSAAPSARSLSSSC